MSTILFVFMTCLLPFLWHFIFKTNNKNSAITNWPVLGMLPALLWNLNHFHDKATEALRQSQGTFEFKGPWLCNMAVLITSDPTNTDHILSKRFSNYPKGREFHETYEPFGDGIIAVDSDLWASQRKMVHSFMKGSDFHLLLEETVKEMVVERLCPVLDRACVGQGEVVDIADVIQRLGFDIICAVILGCDPRCLSMKMGVVSCERAIKEMEEGVLYRNLVPEKYWKLLRWLQVGQEKKLAAAVKVYDRFVYECIDSKRSQIEKKGLIDGEQKQIGLDFLTSYLTKEWEGAREGPGADKYLRDVVTNLVLAGRDSSSAALSWFFWLLAKNPSVEDKILEEIKQKLDTKEEDKSTRTIFSGQELNKLVYLHGALCETLRLYPSIPVNHKSSLRPDTLPSGHRVGVDTKIFISHYAMGRMESVWGGDCLEFKPQRWVSDKGGIVHVPSHKFSAFGGGPRMCLGKDMSFLHMKIVAVAIILRYRFDVVEDHLVVPCNFTVLHMKHGMKVRVTKREL